MAYSTIGNNTVELGVGSGATPGAYFHPKDVEVLMGQAGATAFSVMNAIVNNKDCAIMIAVTDKNAEGAVGYLQEPDHFIAFCCPPLVDQFGGVYIERPFEQTSA